MPLSLFRYQFQAMGSPCELQFYSPDEQRADIVRDHIISDVKRIEHKYSRYREDSVLSEINRAASIGSSVSIDDETAALLNYANTCYQQSQGLFDITSGVLRRIWNFKSNTLPSKAEIRKALEQIGWQKVQIHGSALSFAVKDMQLDFGGIGKEYAVDRAAGIFYQHGIEHGVIDLGGDIKVLGPHSDGRPWSVGIRHPRIPGTLLTTINIYTGALATSGDYERCIVINGRRYSHILNPKTGWPVQGMASVTVVADQCVVAGSACTISMLMEKNGAKWIKQLGLAHVWMDQSGKTGGNLV
ncbi:FAD:protein FMN transferase [Methylicorpusculum sp.]|uniref:FAD:protein FMN transferase n=1 Tax=Methylicorpusculum sp. TaxID=2713644 RepID=UPI0027227801|nr:FAD:protein FMN transferase [Methylicorpusculum sp.]MDO8844316.1 FAD:protein FMN transferase [Methylicorpusculum sp.]